ncbi:MAG: SPFH domain-containing protein [Oscillospiraceae bacterium]|nr:SPFH domain-containing protein [Oscillospiraceae bacterium]
MSVSYSGVLLWIIPAVAAFLIAGLIAFIHIRIVPEGMIYVVERKCRDLAVWESGLHVLMPFSDSIVRMIPTAVQNKEFAVEHIATKDDRFMTASVRISYRITGYQHIVSGGDPHGSAAKMCESSLRFMLEHMKADEAGSERAEVERLLRTSLTDALPRLGVTVDSLELTSLRQS